MTKPPIRAYLWTDEFTSFEVTHDEEYSEIETRLQAALPDREFIFKRDVVPENLGPCELYLFDFGGVCCVDFSGMVREGLTRRVCNAVKDRPNTLFVPWTAMTVTYWKYVLEEMYPDLLTLPNVVVPQPSGYDEREAVIVAKVQEWFQ